jgi:phage terminase large subunit GpA-like protein
MRAIFAKGVLDDFLIRRQAMPSRWASENLVVPDGPHAGDPWNLELTPYIKEPLDFLGPDSGVNELAAMKSAQTGFTTLIIAAIGHSIDRDPCRIMVVQPTDAALSDFNRDKLQPAIDSTKVLSQKVAPQTSRSGEGSAVYTKKFPGGSISLCISTSAADLRSKTIKKLFRDEIDQYPDDLDGQGDPWRFPTAG